MLNGDVPACTIAIYVRKSLYRHFYRQGKTQFFLRQTPTIIPIPEHFIQCSFTHKIAQPSIKFT
jgi:hypothetical protein